MNGGSDSRTTPSFDLSLLGSETPEWERVDTEKIADCRVFEVFRDEGIDPQTGGRHDFFRIKAPDWINIVPITSDQLVVMIEQYRHGSRDVTLEIPGGMVDAGESPLAAAGREMLEETGFDAPEIKYLGKTRPNPALQDNWIHTYLARDAYFKSRPTFEGTERTAVRLVPLADVPKLIAEGVITHSLVIVGFHFLNLFQGGLIKSM